MSLPDLRRQCAPIVLWSISLICGSRNNPGQEAAMRRRPLLLLFLLRKGQTSDCGQTDNNEMEIFNHLHRVVVVTMATGII